MRSSAATFLAILAAAGYSAYAQNNVVVGPGFQRNQQSSRSLTYQIPSGWAADPAAAAKFGLESVLLPVGTTIDNAKAVITVAFQRKDPQRAGLADLQAFVRVDLQNMLAASPSAEAARWQPKGLDPDKVPFMSFEFYGPAGSKVSPQHVVFLDAGDGYFSVALTVEKRDALASQEYEAFFSSLTLQ